MRATLSTLVTRLARPLLALLLLLVTLTLTSQAMAAAPVITNPASGSTLPSVAVGQNMSITINSVGGAQPLDQWVECDANDLDYDGVTPCLPPGLILDPSPGNSTTILHGAPTTAGTYTFSITLNDGLNQGGVATYTLVVTSSAVPTLTDASPNSGSTAGATAVTLTGTNLTGATAVSFGGTAATGFVVNNATTITATTPAHAAGAVDVVVTTPGGMATLTNGYTYTVPAPIAGPVSTTLAANSNAIPIPLPLSGGAASSVAVDTPASHGTATASGTSITYTPTAGYSGSDSFTYTATNASGTSSPATVTITVTPPTLAITPTTLPDGTQGMAYNQTVTATGGTTPYTYAISAGSLPAGLSLNTSTGLISGTPSGTGTGNLTVTVTDANSATGSRAYSLLIYGLPPVANAVSATVTANSSANPITLNLSGGAATSVTVASAASHGAAIASGTSITYTPTAGYSGADSFTYTATNASGTSSPATVSITVNAQQQTQTITFANPGAQNFGTTPTLTATASSGLTPTFTSSTTGVCTITSGGALTFITAGSCTIDADQAGGSGYLPAPQVSRTFSVSAVAPGAPTNVNATAGNAQASVSFTPPASTGGAGIIGYTVTSNSGGITVNGTGSPIVVIGLNNSTAYTFTVTATNSAGTGSASAASNSVTPAANQTITFSNPGTLNFGTTPTLTATADSGLTPTFTSSTPGVCTITSSGALTFISVGTCTINADQAGGSGYLPAAQVSRSFSISAPTLDLTPASLPNGTEGTAYSQPLSASGGTAPYSYAITAGSLPVGLSLNTSTGLISGTPSASGTANLTITATDANGASGSQPYSIIITDQVPVAPAQSINSASPGQPVVIELTRGATGGPFTAANLISMVPANAGTVTISAVPAGAAKMKMLAAAPGNNYSLRFVPNPDVSGVVTLTYTLSNASSTSSPGVISITLTSRSDPSKDAEVQGLINAQANSSRRFASSQISNFQQRLEALHAGNVSSFSNGFALTSASLQRQRQNPNDDPTGIEQWLQIQNAKLKADQALRSNALTQPTPVLRSNPASAQGPELGNQSANGPTSPLAIWTAGTISIGDDASGSSAESQDFVTSGLSVGADYRLAPNLTLGLGFGYGHDKTDIGDNGSRSQADSYSLALYGSYRPIENVYLDAVLGYQRLTFDNRRYVTDTGGRVNGDRDGDQTFASLTAGYEYREESWLISPYARLDLAHATLDSYRERGDEFYALSYEEQTVKTTSSSLGLRSEYALVTGLGQLTPSLRVEYQHDFQAAGDAAMRYSNFGGTRYHSTLDALGQDRGVLGLGLGLLTAADWSLRMEYQYTLSSGAQKAQSMLFNLEKPF